MIKHLKSNKIISLSLIIMCIIIMINPAIYAKSCLNAISVWGLNVLPLLFPFFILTRLIITLNQPKTNVLDKFFCKTYNVPNGSFYTYFLSILSGYPVGAKLISTMYENKQISQQDAYKLLSICSVSGPMFILGTVGISFLKSYKVGLIILISNILASLINGLIYRKGSSEKHEKNNSFTTSNSNILTESVYNSLISILMVGSFIVLSFLIIEILKTLGIINFISKFICSVFNIAKHQNIVESFLIGLIEITRGILELSSTSSPIIIKTILSSSLISFGGISILLQSVGFLNKLKIPIKKILLQKTTQSLICLVISIIISLLFL